MGVGERELDEGSQRDKILIIRYISTRDVIYNMNNSHCCVFYMKFVKGKS